MTDISSALPAIVIATLLSSVAAADVFDDVPQAAGYDLVYELAVPVDGAFHTQSVPWTVDASATVPSFDRVAWYLKLRRANEAPVFVFVSAVAHTANATEIGVPHQGAGFAFQRALQDMTVVSNAANVMEGSGRTGHIEFWPDSYRPDNTERVLGGRDDVYDIGDSRAPGGYGSMQLHDIDAVATLLAYNQWGGGAVSDLGIGNNAIPAADARVHTDWTFRGNAGEYVERSLQILVRPGPTPPGLSISLTQPLRNGVRQWQPGNIARVPVRGRLGVAATRIEARASQIAPSSGAGTGWVVIDGAPSGDTFAAVLELQAGSYTLEVRALDVSGEIDRTMVSPIGVGEVFITAGQSNSANHGLPALRPADARVNAFGGARWQPANDPQPAKAAPRGRRWATCWLRDGVYPSGSSRSVGGARRWSSGARCRVSRSMSGFASRQLDLVRSARALCCGIRAKATPPAPHRPQSTLRGCERSSRQAALTPVGMCRGASRGWGSCRTCPRRRSTPSSLRKTR